MCKERRTGSWREKKSKRNLIVGLGRGGLLFNLELSKKRTADTSGNVCGEKKLLFKPT